jgi:hypothetical protein
MGFVVTGLAEVDALSVIVFGYSTPSRVHAKTTEANKLEHPRARANQETSAISVERFKTALGVSDG